MASKVNVKFVVMLGAALTLVLAGMAAVFFFVLKKSGEDWAHRGDEAMAAQDYEAADQAYSFAVAHDRTNTEWLRKWVEAMGHRVIENEVDFEDRYSKDYTNAIRQVAHMERSGNLQAHMDYLRMRSDQMVGQLRGDAWRFLLGEARASQAFFETGGTPPTPDVTPPEPWHALYKFSGIALSSLYSLNLLENQDEVVACERDLRLALLADPKDSETALELAQFYAVTSDRRRTTPPVDLPASERALRQARELLTAMVERDPSDADSAIGLLQMDVNAARREFAARLSGSPATPAQIMQVVAPFAPRLDAIRTLLVERAATGVGRLTLLRFGELESMAAPADLRKRTNEVLAACLVARPDDAIAMVMRAEILSSAGEPAEAVAELQRLIDLPNKPLGIEGYRLFQMRPVARQMQAEYTLARYDTAPEAERPGILSQASAYREQLAKEVPADSPALLKIDAHMAFLRGQWTEAERLLLAVNERTGGADRDVLWWSAQTAAQLRKLGVARQMLESLNGSQADNPRVLMALAAIEQDLRNTDRVAALVGRLRELRPNDPEIEDFIKNLRGEGNPVQEAFQRYEKRRDGGEGVLPDPDGALAGLVEDFRASNADATLGLALLRIYLDRSDVPKGLEVVNAVLAVQPDLASFKRFQTALARGEIVSVLIDLVNTTEGTTEFQRAMVRRLIYEGRGMVAEAERELAAAEALEPGNRDVIEARFLVGIATNNLEMVKRAAARARELNIDGQNGDIFTSRELMFEGKHREAAALLESLVSRNPNDATLWRLLGVERAEVGRYDEAVTAYKRALEIRPDDIQPAKELISLMVARGNDAQALAIARQSAPFGRGDLDFLNRLWALEARAGARATALTAREELRARDKTLLWNNAQLCELYMDEGRWDEARTLIDEMRAAEDSLGLVALDARWHADRGDFEGARKAYTDYIGSLPAGRVGSAPYIAMATFMQSREQPVLAAAALEGGRIDQDKATMDCDRMLGDVLTMSQRLGEAIEAYKRVVDGGADTPDFMFRKRMVENLIRLERYDEAAANLAAMSALASTDRNIILLNAELQRTRGNRTEAIRLLDEAVRLFPEDPVSYFQRAEALQEDESRLMDALADFDSAIRKAPNFWQALRNRSGIYRRLGRMDEAVADLRSATLAAGTDGDAVTQLLGELMNLRKTQEAASAADEAVAARPTDSIFIQRIAGVFAARGEWSAGARYYKLAFDLRKEAPIAQRYLDCLLNQRPPQTRTAEDVINAMGPELLKNPGLLAASVSINVSRNRMTEAERDASLAFDLVSTDANRLLVWHRTIGRAFGDPAAYQAYLRRLAATKATTALRDWPVLFLAASQATVPLTVSAAIEQLNRLANEGQPMEVRLNAMRTIGTTLYEGGDYSQAADIWTSALRAFPDDWEVNNNLAYVLTEFLGRPQEALAYAIKAVEAQPMSPSVNDTVGWTYFKTGEMDRAMLYLGRSARLSRDASEQTSTVRHIIEVEIARGEKTNATRWLAYLKRVLTESPWLDASIRTAADELEARINSLP